MFFNSLNRKLKKSYGLLNPEIGRLVFPQGEAEYIYVGTILNTLFSKRDVFELIKIYASVYSYYQSTMGNTAKAYIYAKKKASGVLIDYEVKNLIALVLLNLTTSKAGISDPVAAVHQYRKYVDSYLKTVERIKENKWKFQTNTADAGTQNSPLLVDGVCGVRDYIEALEIPGVDKITYEKTASLYLTEKSCDINYAIDEYTLYNAASSTEIAKLWFNIYGSETTNIQPACFSGKEPFSANNVTTELFAAVEKEWPVIEGIVQHTQLSYDRVKLVTATFAYFYVIWSFSFEGIRAGQAEDVKERYIDRFIAYIRTALENAPYKAILESEPVFKDMLYRVDRRVRNSYHENNYTLVDDGLTKEFLQEFIADAAAIEHIASTISKRILEDWAATGAEFDQRYLT